MVIVITWFISSVFFFFLVIKKKPFKREKPEYHDSDLLDDGLLQNPEDEERNPVE